MYFIELNSPTLGAMRLNLASIVFYAETKDGTTFLLSTNTELTVKERYGDIVKRIRAMLANH